MSFILDALRKSEHERQRQTGPALVETPVAAPATRTNRWATAAIVLLLINLVALGVVLLTKSRGEKEIETSTPQPIVASAPPAASADSTASATSATPAAASPAPPPDESSTQAQASVTRAAPALPPMMRPAGHPPVSSGRNPLREEIASDPTPSADAGLAGAATPPPGPPGPPGPPPGPPNPSGILNVCVESRSGLPMVLACSARSSFCMASGNVITDGVISLFR